MSVPRGLAIASNVPEMFFRRRMSDRCFRSIFASRAAALTFPWWRPRSHFTYRRSNSASYFARQVSQVALSRLEMEGRVLGCRHSRRECDPSELAAPGRLRHVHGALEDVPKLAYVPGPVVRHERLHRLGRNGERLAGRRGRAEHPHHERRDVLPPRAQGRNRHRDDRKPEIEVFPELPRLHLAREIPLRRRDDAHVRFDGLVAAHLAELFRLEHAQELRLDVERKLPDFVQEDGAVVGQLERPLPGADRSRVGAALVPKELALDEGVADRSAVDDDEGALRARTLLVDRASENVLAGAGFPLRGERVASVGAIRSKTLPKIVRIARLCPERAAETSSCRLGEDSSIRCWVGRIEISTSPTLRTCPEPSIASRMRVPSTRVPFVDSRSRT